MRRVSQNSGCRFPFPSSLTESLSLLLLLEEGRKWIEKLLASDINTSKVFLQTTGAAWGCTLMCDTLITFDDDFLPPPLPAVAGLWTLNTLARKPRAASIEMLSQEEEDED